MNDLYIHQLETENKQLREALKSTNEVVKEYLEKEKYCDDLQQKIDKAIEYIKTKDLLNERNFMETGIDLLFKELLEILGDKE